MHKEFRHRAITEAVSRLLTRHDYHKEFDTPAKTLKEAIGLGGGFTLNECDPYWFVDYKPKGYLILSYEDPESKEEYPQEVISRPEVMVYAKKIWQIIKPHQTSLLDLLPA